MKNALAIILAALASACTTGDAPPPRTIELPGSAFHADNLGAFARAPLALESGDQVVSARVTFVSRIGAGVVVPELWSTDLVNRGIAQYLGEIVEYPDNVVSDATVHSDFVADEDHVIELVMPLSKSVEILGAEVIVD